jgi:very-short-patch-repair endonuclease
MCSNQEDYDPTVVLIADNIDSDIAKVLENSKDIRKEITKSDNLRNRVKLAYKFPLGGIAFHFKLHISTFVVDFISFSELYIYVV